MHSTKTPARKVDDETSDIVLVALAGEGHEPALNEIMRRYKAGLFQFVVKYVKDVEIAADILQETFIRVYFNAGTYNPQYRFSTWLYQIAINLCRDWNRKNTIKNWLSLDASGNQSLLAEFPGSFSSREAVERDFEHQERLSIVESEISKLPHRLKTALLLYAVEGHSQEKCSELLGVSVKTVETRVYRARKRLTEKIGQSS